MEALLALVESQASVLAWALASQESHLLAAVSRVVDNGATAGARLGEVKEALALEETSVEASEVVGSASEMAEAVASLVSVVALVAAASADLEDQVHRSVVPSTMDSAAVSMAASAAAAVVVENLANLANQENQVGFY